MLTRPQSAVRRPGQVIALTAILLLFLTGMVAFTIDTGYIAATRTELQRTADAAALAAVMKLPGHTTLDKARAAAKAEAKNWAGMSSNGSLALLDADIEVVKYTPSAARGSRLSVPANVGEANAVRVRVRKDASANNPLRLFFAPVFGSTTADVRAEAVAVLQQATAFGPGSDVIPFAVPENYYYRATGQSERPYIDQPLVTDKNIPIDLNNVVQDKHGFDSNGKVTSTGDSVKEFLLYSDTNTAPGNHGTIDLGSKSNATSDITRQLKDGLNATDLSLIDTTMAGNASASGGGGNKVQVANSGPAYHDVVSNGRLSLPQSLVPNSPPPSLAGPTDGVWFKGDPGLSNGMKNEMAGQIGQVKIIPLYSGVALGQGEGSYYRITKFVPVQIMSVDLTGKPKTVYVQPYTGSYVDDGAASGGTGTPVPGVFTRHPKLAVP